MKEKSDNRRNSLLGSRVVLEALHVKEAATRIAPPRVLPQEVIVEDNPSEVENLNEGPLEGRCG